MAKQLKRYAPFYDIEPADAPSVSGSYRLLPYDPNRMRLIAGFTGAADVWWSSREMTGPGLGIPFAAGQAGSGTASGIVDLEWTKDYTLTTSEFWVWVDGSGVDFHTESVTFHPERA